MRTSSGQVYFFVQEVYQNIIRAYRANTTGTPSSFSEMDGGNRPSAASTIWAVDSAIDSSGIVHVLANTEAGPVLYYTFNTNTNKWSGATQVASSAWPSFSGIRQGSASIALVLDSNAIAHVVYSKTVNGFRRVYYNNNQGGSWSHEALVDNQPALQNSHATLAFGPDGTLYAAWFANNGGAGSIYASVRRSSSWSSPALIGDGAWGDAGYSLDQGPALLVSPNGQVHIAYINGWEPVSSAPSGYEYGRVKHFYSSNAGASWISDDPPTRFSHSPSLATDPQSNLYIFGHREQWKAEHCADMYIVAQPSGSGWGTWRELARGCLDSSVTAKWSQYNWNNPEILDFLYWTEHGPNGESDYNKLYYGEIRGGLNAINSLPAAPAP